MVTRIFLTVFCLAVCANAATFTVSKTSDTFDGTCDADCSLREAITAANALPGTDVIIVPPGIYTTTIATTNENLNVNGDFDITDSVRISGEGAGETIVQANAAAGVATDRVFHILGPATSVVIEKMTIRHGRTTNPAAAFRGGGIRNEGDLTIRNATVTQNQTISRGGGIASVNVGTALSLDRVSVTSNQATSTTNGTFGGGVFTNFSTVRIRLSNVSGNSSTATVGANLTANGGGFYALEGNVTIRKSSFNNNIVTGTSALNSSDGGGLRFVGVSAPMTISLDEVTADGNQITEGGSAGAGISIGTIEGATETIFARISNSVFSSNNVTSSLTSPSGAGMIVNGLGRTTVVIENTRFTSNSVVSANPSFDGSGGGVYANAAEMQIRTSVIAGNSAEFGGGIRNDSSPHETDARISTLTLDGSTVENNSAEFGGGVYNRATPTTVDQPVGGTVNLNLRNSTISSNVATFDGGGIYQDQLAATTSGTSINNSTIAFNHADADANLSGNGGGMFNLAGSARLKNTVVAGNVIGPVILRPKSGKGGQLGSSLAPDLSGSYESFDYNLIQDPNTAIITGPQANSIYFINPQLQPLGDNGGFGRTHRLATSSAARNEGDPVSCQDDAAAPVDFDQRGLPRIQGGAVCDIGAVEEGGIVWDGGGADNSFETAQNWEGDAVPADTDYVIFSSASNKDVTVPAGREIRGVIFGGGYTGTMTLAAGNFRVRDRFYLYGGNIICSPGAILDMALGSSFVRHSGYVVGMINHDYPTITDETFFFPTGTATGYFPATIQTAVPQRDAKNRSLGVSSIAVQAVDGTLPGVSAAQSLGMHWNIESVGVASANLTLSYEDVAVAPNANEAAFQFIRRESGVNTFLPATTPDDFFNTFTIEGLGSFSDWTLGALVPTAASARISGRVVTAGGEAISNSTVELTGGNLTSPLSVRTGTFGNYAFSEVLVSETYVVTVRSARHRFSNPSRIVALQDDLIGLDFVSDVR